MSRQAGFFDLDERYAALSAAGDLLDRLGAVICSGKSGLQRLVVTSQEFIRLGTTEAAMKGTAFLLGLALTGATAVGAISGLHAAEEKTKFSVLLEFGRGNLKKVSGFLVRDRSCKGALG